MNQNEASAWCKKQGFTSGSQLGSVQLWAHSDPGYRKRTQANAQCDVTMATAADYSTGGERLTKQMAGEKYIALPFYLDAQEAGSRLADFMESRKARSLNVAGNGIYTLGDKGWSQEAATAWIFECLSKAHALRPIERIQSGGQTGIDWSGAVAAHRLGIPALILFPQGFKQRGPGGLDKEQDPSELLVRLATDSASLNPPTASELSSPKP